MTYIFISTSQTKLNVWIMAATNKHELLMPFLIWQTDVTNQLKEEFSHGVNKCLSYKFVSQSL